jgi:hypothetical protein
VDKIFTIQLHPFLPPVMATNDLAGGIDVAGEVVAMVLALAVKTERITEAQADDLIQGMDKLIHPILAATQAVATNGSPLN